MDITPITRDDFRAFWPTFKAIVEAQETYAFDPNMDFDTAWRLWCELPQFTFVVKQDGELLGSYYLKPNAAGPGDHVCNCGYMVTPQARGKGVARAMCEHSQRVAIEAGYLAMQFNAVVATNEVAIRLWQSLGFEIIGTVPGGYRHRELGLVNTRIMYKRLDTD